MVGSKEAAREDRIIVRAACGPCRSKAVPYFHALDGADAHKGAGKPGIQLFKDRLAQPGRHAAYLHACYAAQRVHVLPCSLNALIPQGDHAFIGTEIGPVKGMLHFNAVHRNAAQFLAGGIDMDAGSGKQNVGYGACSHAGNGLAPGGAAAAAVVAQAEFLEKAVVRMPRPEQIFQIVVIGRVLVLVDHLEGNGRSCRFALKHA